MVPIAVVIVLLVAILIFALLLVGFSIALTSLELRRHFARTIRKWRAEGLVFVRSPVIASILNERRRFGARGNGALALTQKDIRFSRPISQNEIVIPFHEMSDVTMTDTFNGWRTGGPFLVVKRTNGDLTGFRLIDSEAWATSIREQLKV
jgi:hypothetical protein